MNGHWLDVVLQLGIQHLWLSAVVVLIALSISWRLRKADPQMRSRVLAVAFVLALVSPFAIFLPGHALLAAPPAQERVLPAAIASQPAPDTGAAPVDVTRDVPAQHLPRRTATLVITMVWLAGMLYGLVRLGRGWRSTRRLREDAEAIHAGEWCADAVPGNATILASRRVFSPMVVGLRHPCVLIPQRLLDELPPAVLLPVLRHEIAHIRRRDPWVSLLQALGLAVFWWSPMLRLLSRRLDVAREMACDERAALESGDPANYADALLATARFIAVSQLSDPVLAVGILHDRKTLAQRVEGVLQMTTRSRGSAKAAAAGCGVLVLASLSLAVLAAPRVNPASVAVPATDGGGTRLIEAAQAGRIERLRELIAHGADVNASVPGDGTALIVAARRGDLDMVNALLKLGADVNEAVRGDGNPLIAASARGNLEVVKRLLDAGAKINAVVVDDETPLINASRSGSLQTVEYLVEHGASVSLGVMADGHRWRTPLNQARTDAIRDYLLSKGAATSK